ncbi:MAG: CHAT domain-containing protein [Deltaproteobacteria bacterium]|nr:CHAT domain-containing protein [Deltaproteobacteria bacterium]
MSEIIIEIGNGGSIKAQSSGGAEGYGELDLDPLRRDTIRVFEDWLLSNGISKRQELIVLGQHLYQAIFGRGDRKGRKCVSEILKEKLDSISKGERLRLQLKFVEDSTHLISLPWEFLYSLERGSFLATDVNLVLSRYMPLGTDREPLQPEEGPLRILITISRPKDQDEVISREVVQAIEDMARDGRAGEGIAQEENRPAIDVQVLRQPTLDALEGALKSKTPHVLHFIGHGKYDEKEKQGGLALIDPNTGQTDWLDDATLIEIFQHTEVFPRLVFLHMCEGGAAEGDASALQAFSGFAPKLIHAKIPCVVAMQYPIKNQDARSFAIAFYGTLAKGGTVDEAVQDGRYSIDKLRKTRVFGTPVLYMHSADGIIMPRKDSAAVAERGMPSKSAPPPDANGHAKISPAPATGGAFAGVEHHGIEKIEDRIIDAGSARIDAIADAQRKLALLRRLPQLRGDLAGRSIHDMANILFCEWQKERDEDVKLVWSAMMDALPQ